MSDNPFKSRPDEPVPVPAGAPSEAMLPPMAPGALTPILVFCLIFGIMGLLGVCLGGVGLALIGVAEQFLEAAQLPDEQLTFQKLTLNAQQAGMLPNIILLVANIFVATMLIIGAIGCFKRKEPSRLFLRTALLVAIIYSVLKIVAGVYSYFVVDAALASGVEAARNDPIYQDLKAQYTASQIGSVGGLVFIIVTGLVILGFYLWARSYLGKTEVVDHFAAVEKYKQRLV